MKLTKAQERALSAYARQAGPTSLAIGRVDTFTALVRKGFLRRSYGLGVIEAEITEAGRAALLDTEGAP